MILLVTMAILTAGVEKDLFLFLHRCYESDTSRLIMFEKGSLTATAGGYRLMASQVDNTTAETDGYVAFDLFIKNFSGEEYYANYDPQNEEAIYLTPESTVNLLWLEKKLKQVLKTL